MADINPVVESMVQQSGVEQERAKVVATDAGVSSVAVVPNVSAPMPTVDSAPSSSVSGDAPSLVATVPASTVGNVATAPVDFNSLGNLE